MPSKSGRRFRHHRNPIDKQQSGSISLSAKRLRCIKKNIEKVKGSRSFTKSTPKTKVLVVPRVVALVSGLSSNLLALCYPKKTAERCLPPDSQVGPVRSSWYALPALTSLASITQLSHY